MHYVIGPYNERALTPENPHARGMPHPATAIENARPSEVERRAPVGPQSGRPLASPLVELLSRARGPFEAFAHGLQGVLRNAHIAGQGAFSPLF